MDDAVKQFPFRCTLSFGPMIDFLRRSFEEGGEFGRRREQEREETL